MALHSPKPHRLIVFTLNDHYDLKIRVSIFSLILLSMTLLTVTIPYIALLTVPTYLTILFAIVSEKVDIIQSEISDDSEE